MYWEVTNSVFVAVISILMAACILMVLSIVTKLWLTTTVQGRLTLRYIRRNWYAFWQYLRYLTLISRNKQAAWKWYRYLRESLPGHPHHMYVDVLRAEGYDVTDDGAQEFDELYAIIVLKRQIKEVQHE